MENIKIYTGTLRKAIKEFYAEPNELPLELRWNVLEMRYIKELRTPKKNHLDQCPPWLVTSMTFCNEVKPPKRLPNTENKKFFTTYGETHKQ